MLEIKNFENAFSSFKKNRSGKEPGWLTGLREKSFENFKKLGLPGNKHEDWLYTRVDHLSGIAMTQPDGDVSAAEALVKAATFEGLDTYRYVFVNGRFSPQLSNQELLPGLTIKPLSNAIVEDEALVQKHLGSTLNTEEYTFQALSNAFASEGLFIHAAQNAKVDKPLELLFLNTVCGEIFYSPRNLYIIENGADLTLLESCVADAECKYFSNSATEVICSEHTKFNRYKIIRDGNQATHFTTTSVTQARESKFSSLSLMLSGSLIRNDLFVSLNGENCENILRGLYSLKGKQQSDTFTRVVHGSPNCYSEQLFKGVLDGHSKGVFDGRILVKKGAQKTDAVQKNPSLLLSDNAVAYAKPQLEIYADDVKCTHAATTGQLDSEQIYYLRSRGLSESDARAMLTFGFAGEIVEFIDLEPVRDKLTAELLAAMS